MPLKRQRSTLANMRNYIYVITVLFVQLLSPNSFASYSYSEQLIKEYKKLIEEKYVLLPHRGTYVLPVNWNDNPNNQFYEGVFEDNQRGDFVRPFEAEVQVSFSMLTSKNIFKTPWHAFVGYTNHSWWQVYNSDWSKPFRETNYIPEFYIRRVFDEPIRVLGTDIIAYDFGIVHESNGQIQELSRSWNRLYLRGTFVIGSFSLSPKFWYRIPDKGDKDDNPTIQDYMGYGELRISYEAGENQYSLLLRKGKKDYGAAEFTYSYPFANNLRFYMKAIHGYGASLQDFDNETRSLALGFSIEDLLATGESKETAVGSQ